MIDPLLEMACPAIPEWLKEAERLSREDLPKFDALPPHIQVFYFHYREARQGHGRAAPEHFAQHYESGDVPSGPDMEQAMVWHQYAVTLGSISSALRLAELLAWPGSGEDIQAGIGMAQRALEIQLEYRRLDKEALQQAAAAARFLLARDPDDTSRELIEELLAEKRFATCPDAAPIAARLHALNCQAGNEPLSLKVAQTAISEEGNFKAGIYKALELPLPLVPVAADPAAIRDALDREFPWFREVNEHIYRQMVVAQSGSMPAFRIRPLLLAGVAGVGKTTWATRLAELCNVPFRTVAAAGGADSLFLRGTPRGWSTARPGAVIQTMAAAGVANPLFLVDELEKASPSSHNGRIWDVLLQLLEPASSRTYLDECLQVPCDLSWVSWIASVNELSPLPRPLLDRFTVMLVKPPGAADLSAIVDGAVRGFAQSLGVDPRMLPALDGEERGILRGCKNPREINRTVCMMIEQRLVEAQQNWRH